MREPVWIPQDLVTRVHLRQLAEHGGSQGIRDGGLLDSALLRPQNKFSYETPDLHDLAAAYAYGIARNHPFIDGNKRTALVVSFLFLFANGHKVTASYPDRTMQFMALAAGDLSEEALAAWFRGNSEPF